MEEFTKFPEIEEEMEPVELLTSNIFADSSSGKTGYEVRVVLVSPDGHKLNCALSFEFKATNNEAKS